MCVTAAALGAPVAALVQRCGAPVRTVSSNDGNHVTFRDGGATVDALVDADTAAVRALDVRAAAPVTASVRLDGAARVFAFGTYDIAHADAELAQAADVTFDTSRSYALDDRQELLLAFDPATKRLARLVVGARPILERLGLLPAPIDHRPYTYRAPVPKRVSLHDGGGRDAALVRVDVDRYGIVRAVSVVAPSSDAAFDATIAGALGDDTYAPAQLAGRPVSASVFREVQP